MYSDESGRLHTDVQQDYTVLDVHARANRVHVTFERKYDTCDVNDYLIDVSVCLHLSLTWHVKSRSFYFRPELLIFWSSYQATLAEVLKTMTSGGLTSDCFELNSSKVNFLTSNLLMTTLCSKWKLKMYIRLRNYILPDVFHVVTNFTIRVCLI